MPNSEYDTYIANGRSINVTPAETFTVPGDAYYYTRSLINPTAPDTFNRPGDVARGASAMDADTLARLSPPAPDTFNRPGDPRPTPPRGYADHCHCAECHQYRGETGAPPVFTQLAFPGRPYLTWTAERVAAWSACDGCATTVRFGTPNYANILLCESCEVCDVCDHGRQSDEQCDHCHHCSQCGDAYADEDDLTYVHSGSQVCNYCLRRAYWRCDSCDTWNSDNDSDCQDWECSQPSCDDDDGCGDDDCDRCADNAGIRSYSYKPTPDFHGNGPTYLGLELEVECDYGSSKRRAASTARNALGSLGYLKSDSSVSNGFEIVTHPMSWDYALNSFPWDMLGDLRDNGAGNSQGTAGIHVHVSRAGFDSPCHVYRWLKFIRRNKARVETLARRKGSRWASFGDEYDAQRELDFAKGDTNGERYRAVNPCNDDTFEVRVFRSSLDPQEVQAALAFVAASVEYTRTLRSSDIIKLDGWSWGMFVGFLLTRPEYAPLTAELEKLACVS